MKIGIIGSGSVGKACAMATIMRGCAREIVLIDKNTHLAKAVATDMQYGSQLSPETHIYSGDYSDLHQSALVMVTAGVNEKTGGATDRNDPAGRLKLLHTNAEIFKDIIPQIVKAVPKAIILIVSDPPDPLADVARQLAGHDRVLSAGTYLDTLRFRYHIARHFQLNPRDVNAQVIGEHGTSSVFLWSGVTIGGKPLDEWLTGDKTQFKHDIEQEVKFANITIIEGNNASQYGIGMVCARIAEIVIRNEESVIPIGSYHADYGVTFSLPSILNCKGIRQVLIPSMSDEEKLALEHCAMVLKNSLNN
ncbi:lactate/malate family dehydrogenase [Legionella bononiensis]|uniref:Lactate dehydrogenase n=1 Tax=Legionella bononiensis TaxID=2793102 RepID=A0ABS1WEJ4_9GAMM|nr:lactate dehydrogenase [Legionella bononiensis]MBL7479325.1 lactate dehydrogenase [Legionella bononiensis]MBL7479355.1 lactate dehydrogenase [Legionella bononiensis]MBL7527771.1 lactate dehydrogenase [Legionella bononiensis]MBL7563548.1 lactate dehydrogenase [Legionella bononiensis]